jgi:HK97 gp10 family phage protein
MAVGSVRTRIIITKIVAPDELGRQIEPKMQNLTNAITRRMQRLVPKKTWVLHDSIVNGVERKGAVVKGVIGVGSKRANYWDMVERGTSRMAAQPYMRPALLQSKSSDLNFTGTPAAPHGTPAERKAVQRANRAHNAAVKRAESKGEA